ncbi:putative non-heme bromoperoxidase BpoC [Variibacter gotjawalensis]|uniref:Putative non-heme bromoperoxidase BpoC n=1 Tax=Variibacter gotjawalensis TaxID=1333996 RepID=A0A0S3PY80_9BRAD|nr:alpha/beta fold hydrolase [Variibacter gotjawalensis]NIK46671.1 pimeloyl-ACP methyl ester carboxylesterase [Variibacter gotjawalensis]RZS48574.1 pimeloyl-ACP methyl ester carboxylesterase [Variibacter gotjawalensis]BAT60836.1 putative non-heme bromoperoxidase BpoC [Variibacter gotjawalensis]
MADPLPTVLVPGLNCSARLYAAQIPVLWRFGPVQVANHTDADTMAQIARQILSNAPPLFALVGLSMGGYIALEIMRQAPQRVGKLALLDTSARPDTPEQSAKRDNFISMAEAGRFAEVTETLWPVLVDPSRQKDVTLKGEIVRMADDVGPEAFVRQQRAIKSRADSRPLLKEIQCPALVLVGANDQLTPPELADEMAAGIAGADLVKVPDCGHMSTMEKPEIANRALAALMQKG